MELAILGWALTFAVVAIGAFVVARSIVQIAAIAYGVMERRLEARRATRQTAVLAVGAVLALGATALVGAFAILALLARLLEGNTF